MPATRPVEREFVTLESPTMVRAGAGGMPVQGCYYTPAGERPGVAFVATHYNVDFSEHYLAEHLAALGYGFLGWNTRFRGNEAYFLLEHALVDIGVGVRWLRDVAGAERIVLLGNSGGGSLMGAYQSQATEPNIPPSFGMQLPEAVLELPAADAFVALNAHLGRPEVLTAWLDPSVTDEVDPLAVDPALDMFSEVNGPPYSPDFVERYRAAQLARNDRITTWAKAELDRLEAGGAWDRLFDLNRVWADLRFCDLTIDPSDREVGCYAGDARRANYGAFGIGRTNTLRSWLSMWSLSDSPCSADPHLRRLDVPALVVQSTADQGVFPSDARALHDAIGSRDKALTMIEGDHYLRDKPTHRPGVAALIAAWTTDHVPA